MCVCFIVLNWKPHPFMVFTYQNQWLWLFKFSLVVFLRFRFIIKGVVLCVCQHRHLPLAPHPNKISIFCVLCSLVFHLPESFIRNRFLASSPYFHLFLINFLGRVSRSVPWAWLAHGCWMVFSSTVIILQLSQYPVNMPDLIWKHFWIWTVMAIMASV